MSNLSIDWPREQDALRNQSSVFDRRWLTILLLAGVPLVETAMLRPFLDRNAQPAIDMSVLVITLSIIAFFMARLFARPHIRPATTPSLFVWIGTGHRTGLRAGRLAVMSA